MVRAAVLVAPGTIELQHVRRREPAPDSIVVRVRAALTDGTDLKAYRRGHPKMPMPTRFGHEFSGDIVAVGRDVREFRPGDAVMGVHTAPCGRCFWCEREQEELCETLLPEMILGAYADEIEIPPRIVARNLYRKPEHLSYVAAAFLEPLACVVRSLRALDVAQPTAVIFGDGGFGLLHAALLRAFGGKPILVGRHAERLSLARGFGVEHTIEARHGRVREKVLALTNGRGADAVFECTGRVEVWETAPDAVRRGGRVVFFGGLPSDARVSFLASRLHYDEVSLVSPFHFTPADVRTAYEMLAQRRIDPLPLVSASVALDEIASAFIRLDAGEGIKFAIVP